MVYDSFTSIAMVFNSFSLHSFDPALFMYEGGRKVISILPFSRSVRRKNPSHHLNRSPGPQTSNRWGELMELLASSSPQEATLTSRRWSRRGRRCSSFIAVAMKHSDICSSHSYSCYFPHTAGS
jgi:hypothetical protein